MHPDIRQILAALVLLLPTAGVAIGAETPSAPDPQARMEAAGEAARAAIVRGPQTIPLGSQGTLKLPEGYGFVPKAQAQPLLEAQGDQVGTEFQGILVGDHLDGFLVLEFEAAGYVKDEDAQDWNADELLKGLQEGTEASNSRRRELGVPEFGVIGWVEPPHYDAATHRLVWAASTREKGGSDQADGVNYNTFVLGREGFFSMNLVTDLAKVDEEKPAAHELLAALEFSQGKRYADFDASTDKVAAYGLAALVAGVAAKKLGLLAVIGVFLAKAWKLLAIGAVALAAVARKFFGGKGSA